MADWSSLKRAWGEPGDRWVAAVGPPARRAGSAWVVPCVAPVQGCGWSADGRWVAVASGGRMAGADGTVRVLDSRTGATWLLRGHGRGTHDVAFDAKTGWLVSAGHDGALGVWDLEHGEGFARRDLAPRHRVQIAAVPRWLVVGEEIASEGARSAVEVLDLGSGDRVWRRDLAAGRYTVALAASVDGTRVVVSSARADGTRQHVTCWEVPGGRRVWRHEVSSDVLVHALRWTGSGLVQSDSGPEAVRVVRLRDPETGEVVRSSAVEPSVMGALAVHGERAFSIGRSGRVHVLSLPDLESVATYEEPGLPTLAVAVAPDGERIAIGGVRGEGVWVGPLSPP